MPLAIHPEARIQHFLSRVDQLDDFYGCWLWRGYVGKDGYGQVRFERQSYRIHRVIYAALVGPILPGLTLDHLCRNRACVNPAHLEIVSKGENVLRGDGVSAKYARATHCKHGHPFSPENTVWRFHRSRPCRRCRICDQNRDRLRGQQAERKESLNNRRRYRYATEPEYRKRRLLGK